MTNQANTLSPEDLAKLSAWMDTHISGFAGPLHAEKFAGGQSNPTYKLQTPERAYVLRRKPLGKTLKGAHAVDREFRIMRALGPSGFPVPETLGLCEDNDIIGSAFYIMAMVEGRIFWDPTFPDVARAEKHAYYEAMIGTLAALHQTDYAAIGLADYGRPGNYCARQVSRLSKQYFAEDKIKPIADMDAVIEWLKSNVPETEQTSIVHGDYRCDNMIFHPTEPRVIAVLDWELSTLGDPMADLAFHVMNYITPVGAPASLNGKPLDGIPAMQDYIDMYCAKTGSAGITDLRYYLSFSLFRLAAILHGIKGRMIRGNASNPRAAQLVSQLEPLCAAALAQTKA